MIVNRRTFSAMVASAVAAPRMSFAQVNDRSAFYSGVGGQLSHFEVDFGAAALANLGLRGFVLPQLPARAAMP